MEFYFDQNGKILQLGRPYINEEEFGRSIAIYNPEGGPHYGLYSNLYYPNCASKGYYWPKRSMNEIKRRKPQKPWFPNKWHSELKLPNTIIFNNKKIYS